MITIADKYELTRRYRIIGGTKVYQIRALRNFGNVLKGELGGYVESKHNLLNADTCWIKDNAVVMGDAQIYGKAIIKDNAIIGGKTFVSHKSVIGGNMRLSIHGTIEFDDFRSSMEGNMTINSDYDIFLEIGHHTMRRRDKNIKEWLIVPCIDCKPIIIGSNSRSLDSVAITLSKRGKNDVVKIDTVYNAPENSVIVKGIDATKLIQSVYERSTNIRVLDYVWNAELNKQRMEGKR